MINARGYDKLKTLYWLVLVYFARTLHSCTHTCLKLYWYQNYNTWKFLRWMQIELSYTISRFSVLCKLLKCCRAEGSLCSIKKHPPCMVPARAQLIWFPFSSIKMEKNQNLKFSSSERKLWGSCSKRDCVDALPMPTGYLIWFLACPPLHSKA